MNPSLTSDIIDFRVKAIIVGTPKTGTTSMAGIFEKAAYRSQHEPGRADLVPKLYNHHQGLMSDSELLKWLQNRNQVLNLEVESNCFLTYRFDIMRSAYPDYQVVLMYRDIESWLESIIKNNLLFKASESDLVMKYHHVLFEIKNCKYSKYEKPLEESGLYSLDNYLGYYCRIFSSLIEAVGRENLFLMNTSAIHENLKPLSSFLRIPDLDLSLIHI